MHLKFHINILAHIKITRTGKLLVLQKKKKRQVGPQKYLKGQCYHCSFKCLFNRFDFQNNFSSIFQSIFTLHLKKKINSVNPNLFSPTLLYFPEQHTSLACFILLFLSSMSKQFLCSYTTKSILLHFRNHAFWILHQVLSSLCPPHALCPFFIVIQQPNSFQPVELSQNYANCSTVTIILKL